MVLFSSPFLAVYLIVLTALLGLFLGSALNCLAYRIAHKEKWSTGRSKCPKCGHTLSALDLVPLFSWLFLGGKCRYCKEKVSARYPITEALLAVLLVGILLKFDVTLYTLNLMILVVCLFTLSLVDLDIQEIPNRFLIIPAVCQLAYSFYAGGLLGLWNSVWHALLIGCALLLLSLVMDKLFKKDSLGGGDIKLLALLGLYFSLPELLLLLLAACVIGLVIAFILKARKGEAFPFGPAISIAAYLVLLFGTPIIMLYMGLF